MARSSVPPDFIKLSHIAMDPNYLSMFDDPINFRRKQRSAGYSVAATVVVVALVGIVLLIIWQLSVPGNPAMVDDESAMLLDQQAQNTNQLGATTTDRDNTMSATEAETIRTYTRTELTGIQERLEAEEDYDAALQELEDLEADLESAYADTTGAMRENWDELRTQFDELEDSLRTSSADSLAMLASLLESFEAEVRVDEEE